MCKKKKKSRIDWESSWIKNTFDLEPNILMMQKLNYLNWTFPTRIAINVLKTYAGNWKNKNELKRHHDLPNKLIHDSPN